MEKGNFKLNNIIKTLLIFLFYFTYNNIISSICNVFDLTYDLSITLYADCVLMLAVIYIYQNNIKNDFIDLKKNYTCKRFLKTIFLWILIILIFNLLLGFITELISPGLGVTNDTMDNNYQKIYDLYNISTFYTIFKTMIFGVIAEELLFRESVRDVIHNKYIFIIISALIYTTMNFIYTDFSSKFLLLDITLIYFIPSLFFSTAYIKNNSNIVIFMLIKFTYNLIPLTLLLLGI